MIFQEGGGGTSGSANAYERSTLFLSEADPEESSSQFCLFHAIIKEVIKDQRKYVI